MNEFLPFWVQPVLTALFVGLLIWQWADYLSRKKVIKSKLIILSGISLGALSVLAIGTYQSYKISKIHHEVIPVIDSNSNSIQLEELNLVFKDSLHLNQLQQYYKDSTEKLPIIRLQKTSSTSAKLYIPINKKQELNRRLKELKIEILE